MGYSLHHLYPVPGEVDLPQPLESVQPGDPGDPIVLQVQQLDVGGRFQSLDSLDLRRSPLQHLSQLISHLVVVEVEDGDVGTARQVGNFCNSLSPSINNVYNLVLTRTWFWQWRWERRSSQAAWSSPG